MLFDGFKIGTAKSIEFTDVYFKISLEVKESAFEEFCKSQGSNFKDADIFEGEVEK